MLISDAFVFIDLPKCASSYLQRTLHSIAGGERRGTHVPAGAELFGNGRAAWSSIRDPWDWYLSLWAYGCDGKGALLQALTTDAGWLRSRGWKQSLAQGARGLFGNPRQHRRQWLDVYADVNDAARFRTWLQMVHDPRSLHDVGDGFSQQALAGFAGLFTYRYLKLCCRGNFRRLDTHAALRAHDAKHCYIDTFIRVEQLLPDLLDALAGVGIVLPGQQVEALQQAGRSNSSSRQRNRRYYYDAQTAALVRDRDQLIVQKFGYNPPQTG
jgi:hypothetical protein